MGRAEVKSQIVHSLAYRHHLLAATDVQTRPWSWCCDRRLVKSYFTMSARSSARPSTGTCFTVENHKYVSRHVLALLIVCVCVWMERLGVLVDIPDIPGRQYSQIEGGG